MTKQTAKLNSIAGCSIPNGSRFIALYGDGSGARLFLIDDAGGLFEAQYEVEISRSPDTYLIDHNFCFWIPLPNSFKFWFEREEERRP